MIRTEPCPFIQCRLTLQCWGRLVDGEGTPLWWMLDMMKFWNSIKSSLEPYELLCTALWHTLVAHLSSLHVTRHCATCHCHYYVVFPLVSGLRPGLALPNLSYDLETYNPLRTIQPIFIKYRSCVHFSGHVMLVELPCTEFENSVRYYPFPRVWWFVVFDTLNFRSTQSPVGPQENLKNIYDPYA